MLIASIIFCDLYAQQINDSTKITKINKKILVIRRSSGCEFIIDDKRIINEFYTDSTTKISKPICSSFFVHNITKYKSYYIITFIGENDKLYEVVSPRKFKIFGTKIKQGKRYTLTLYPCYSRDLYKGNTVPYFLAEGISVIDKNSILHVMGHFENIYAVTNLDGIFISEKENIEIPKFDIDKYLSIWKIMAKTNKVRR